MNEDGYIKEQKIQEKTDDERNLELIMSVIKTKRDLDSAHKNYEFAEDGLIDYYLYQIKANQTKLDYLLKKAKKEGLSLDMLNEMYLRSSKAQ